MLARLSVRAGMFGVLTVFVLTLCVAVSIIWMNARNADKGFQMLKETFVEQDNAVGRIQSGLTESYLRIVAAHRDILANDQERAVANLNRADQALARADSGLQHLLSRPKTEPAQRISAAIQQVLADSALRQSIQILRSGNLQAYTPALLEKRNTQEAELARLFAEFTKLTDSAAEEQLGKAHERLTLANITSITLFSLTLALAISCWLFIARQVLRPLEHAGEALSRVSDGDLTHRVDITSRNEIGRLLTAVQRMQESLTRTVAQVRNGVDEINVGASQIAKGNLDLSSRTEQQAASLEETAASMEQLSATVKQNADNAQQANQLAIGSMDVAQRGGQAVDEVVTTMQDISGSSHKIAEIVGVIDSIAFQTNILALNAAVEAARAGEQGKGFAVVASEVRTLAQRSAQAAREIKTLIEDSVTRVEAGSRQVERAGTTMREIVESVQRVTDIMGEISAATQEQSSGIDQVNTAVRQMDEVTQQNAALVQEAAAAAGSLEDQARQLHQAVAVFRINARDVIEMPHQEAPVLR